MKQLMLLTLLLGLMPLNLFAATPTDKGLALTLEADRRDTGFGDFTAEVTMILKDRQGRESVRNIQRRTLEMQGDGDKDLAIFEKPRDVAGTAVLTFSHGLEPDDQWVYLPAAKRVKRISSVNKSGPFMGSEFAYEDIASQEVEKYTYTYLRDEVIDGYDCYGIEATPAYKYSGYTRQIRWLDKEIYRKFPTYRSSPSSFAC